MKKIIGLFCLILLSLTSCKSSKSSSAAAWQKEKIIKGKWKLQNVSFSPQGKYEAMFYGDTPLECIKGSQWEFVPNNNTCNYKVNTSNCNSIGNKEFIFSLPQNEATTTQGIILKPKKQDKVSSKGYRSDLIKFNSNEMVWNQSIYADGQPVTITMNFIR